ncbi:DegT/DnrJ/EryC1/StrS family aminotransferase, partial [Thermodesulfobacteriota bacterium]
MEKRIPFLDLRVTDKRIREELLGAVADVFRHGRFIMGPEVEAFEKEVALRCARRYAVGVNSGSDALFLALKS